MTTIVTLDEAKTFLGVEHDGADAALARMIESAQEALEQHLKMAFISLSLKCNCVTIWNVY